MVEPEQVAYKSLLLTLIMTVDGQESQTLQQTHPHNKAQCLSPSRYFTPLLIHGVYPSLTWSKLNDPSLLHEASLLKGKWVQAQAGKRFNVEGEFPDI